VKEQVIAMFYELKDAKTGEILESNMQVGQEISFLTKSVFGKIIEPQSCDVLFVFSGTHPGHWEKAIEAYQKGYVRRIIVTGGRSLTGTPHPDWNGHTEAEVIIQHLLAAGIPEEAIKSESSSSNTLENVLFAKEIFDFNTKNLTEKFF